MMWEAGESNPLFMANKISKSSLDFMGKKMCNRSSLIAPPSSQTGEPANFKIIK